MFSPGNQAARHDASTKSRGRLCAAAAAILASAALLFAAAEPGLAARAEGDARSVTRAGGGSWPWPVVGELLTPFKNGNNRYAAGQHRGIDIAAPVGRPVLAIVAGRVSFAGRLPDGGRAVSVLSSDARWLVSSLHLSTSSVRIGQSVRPGQRIGAVGTSGRRSADAPHLHLSVRVADTRDYVDPMTLLGGRRLATLKTQRVPSVHALERHGQVSRNAESRNNVRAHTTGDEMSASRHGVQVRRPAAGRSAGKQAREGHAAEKIGRVAPPPITRAASPKERAASAASPAQAGAAQGQLARAGDVRPRQAQQAQAERANKASESADSPSDRPLRRMLLLAIAALCLVALGLRSRVASPADPTAAPEPQQAAAAAGEVIELKAARRRA